MTNLDRICDLSLWFGLIMCSWYPRMSVLKAESGIWPDLGFIQTGTWSLPLYCMVKVTLKSLLQYHSSHASILRCSGFFVVQLSYPYMTTGKTIALTICTFVGKVMSLLFSKLSRFVIAFLPRSKHLLILWLQSLSAVISEAKKIKSVTVSIIKLSICH